MINKMKVSKEKIYNVYNMLINMNGSYKTIINMIINENLMKFQDLANEIIKEQEKIQTKNYKKFIYERDLLLVKYASKNNKNEVIVNNEGSFVFDTEDNRDGYLKDMAPLEEQYTTDIEIVKQNEKKFREYIEEEVEVEIYQVSCKKLVDVSLTIQEYVIIMSNFCYDIDDATTLIG